jgi:hypothetical protein
MSDVCAVSKYKSISIEATVTRADGTVENLGVISYWHINPLKMFWWQFKRWFCG